MLGPQWLCECNASGGAKTAQEAGKEAAHHLLKHWDAGDTSKSVSVYRERNDWLYSIDTGDKAMEIAYPLQEVSVEPLTRANTGRSTITTSMQLPPGATIQVGDGRGVPQTYTYTLSSPLATPPQQWRPGQAIELGSLTMEQAASQFRDAMNAMLAGSRRYNPTVRDAMRGI